MCLAGERINLILISWRTLKLKYLSIMSVYNPSETKNLWAKCVTVIDDKSRALKRLKSSINLKTKDINCSSTVTY